MKSKLFTLCTISMIGLLLVFAMLDIGTSTTISNIPSRGLHTILTRWGGIEYSIYEINFTVRKTGHFVFYALLSPMIAISLFNKYKKLILAVLFSGALTLVIAFSDEFIQHYARGRNASFFDIAIDMAGAVTGLLIFIVSKQKSSMEL